MKKQAYTLLAEIELMTSYLDQAVDEWNDNDQELAEIVSKLKEVREILNKTTGYDDLQIEE